MEPVGSSNEHSSFVSPPYPSCLFQDGPEAMDISTVRPKVAQLTFQLLGRSVHPELFHIYKSQQLARENFSARIFVTTDGHVVSWTAGNSTLTEVVSSSHQLVPKGRHLFSIPLRHSAGDTLPIRDGIEYKYDFELERVPAEMFWMIQKQLGESSKDHELIQVFDSSGRIAIGGLSFVHVETRQRSLHIQAIHTFPDDLALVKTESIFRIHP